MRTRSPLVLDVLELLESPGSRKRYAFAATVEGLAAGLAHVTGELGFDLTLEAIDGGVFVKGSIGGSYDAECSRCLEPITRSFDLAAAELYRPAGDAWEEGYVIDETHVDLAPLARDTVLLDLPQYPLCRPDCAGLCPQCGADRNQDPCDCVPDQGDPRWLPLKELGDQLG